MKISVIPARGGSKRIPRKNIKPFNGKPMIAWSIEAAKASCLFEHVIVSTDDQEIAEIALHYGAEVPFIRPLDLSDDFATTTEVIAHSTKWLMNEGLKFESVCCIYATAPFLQVEDIKLGSEILDSGDWDYVFAATDYAASIFRSFKETNLGGVEMFFPDYFSTRSQDLPIALHDAGQFYWGRPEAWLGNKCIFSKSSRPILIPRWRVQDIDTVEDWRRAEILAPVIMNNY